jgi:hypothetical protein
MTIADETETSVSTAVCIDIRLSRYLAAKGHDVSFHFDTWIISKTLPTEKKFLWWSWTTQMKYVVAEISIREPAATRVASKWRVDVFGNDHLDELSALARDLTREFQVKGHVCLKREDPIPHRIFFAMDDGE